MKEQAKKEIFKPVKGFEEYYEISNFGRVKSIRYNRIKKVYLNKKTGYLNIDFNVNGLRTKHSIHRLVALHFVDGFKDRLEVNHIDCDKINNDPINLEWITRSANTQHAYDNGLISKGNRGKRNL